VWQIEWEYASEIERHNILIDSIRDELNLTDEQINEMFLEGSTL
jgi:hypothetical protein